ncbi:MAG: elongation factor 4, partial [Candidatus Roizmanbacteria bacterium]|nr:elongation factor 4 [Candidatus Roizmanbacteria bacterium]
TAGSEFRLIATNSTFTAQEVGIFLPDLTKQTELTAGSIGYIVTSLKDIHDVRVGDTIRAKASKPIAIPGYKESKPMVFASVFPTEPDDFPLLKKAMDKLTLNDAALQYSQIGSNAFGAGLHVGFLGLLHADVTRERLEREFGQSIILTPPQVEYRKEGDTFLEPVAKLTVVTRPEYVGAVMRLCDDSRGIFTGMDNARQVVISYEMPLVEIITSFFDRLKTITSGYASIDWELIDYRVVKAERLQILLNGTVVDEFSEIVVAERAEEKARFITSRLRELIPRQQFEVRIQAFYQGRIIASERISPLRKDVTAGMYGGDRTRKDKLLNKQKKGKKLMKQVGTVTIPKETFMKLFQEK